ncbi:cytochrome c [Paracoccus sp. TK19116]|uniref:Cytochrome c n=1 Tax=Paracoccus albicereus TaxID=2922394 RepID=A0ABT1MV05_9RHOB|nr:cytochrome c [Paracoccus albicereus]MCQ0972194.1 cytochrome c [Paracoccus albicereus]
MKILLAAAAIMSMPVIVHAQSVEDAIEARHGFYKMLSINMGTLAGMAKGEIEYDEAAASRAGANIEALVGYDLPSLFVEGSSMDDNMESAAKPEIWDNPDDFAAKFEDLRSAAAGASDAVMGGQENVGPVVQKLGAACKACHDEYRQPET